MLGIRNLALRIRVRVAYPLGHDGVKFFTLSWLSGYATKYQAWCISANIVCVWSHVLVPIFKNKDDVQSCSNYRGIKLNSSTLKIWESDGGLTRKRSEDQ